MSLKEWMELNEQQRLALMRAGQMRELETAGRIGIAQRDPIQSLVWAGDKEAAEDALAEASFSEWRTVRTNARKA